MEFDGCVLTSSIIMDMGDLDFAETVWNKLFIMSNIFTLKLISILFILPNICIKNFTVILSFSSFSFK